MNPNPEYEAAVEIISNELCRRGFTETFQTARAILELTHPSGQPVIGVIAQYQGNPPSIHASTDSLMRGTMALAADYMRLAGFRRMVQLGGD